MGTPLKKRSTGNAKVISDKSVKDYANDPYFIKKREKAEKFLKKENKFTWRYICCFL
jgi:hypothetical protein